MKHAIFLPPAQLFLHRKYSFNDWKVVGFEIMNLVRYPVGLLLKHVKAT